MSIRKEEEQLLQSRINANQLHYPKLILRVLATFVALQPVLYSYMVHGVTLTVGSNGVQPPLRSKDAKKKGVEATSGVAAIFGTPAIVHYLLFMIVMGGTAYMLYRAYVVMIETEFWGRQKHFTEVKGDADERALRRIRLQRAMGYALFFINTGFFLLDTLFLSYLLHQMDPRANFLISSFLSSALMWFLAEKNEESRQKRLRRHK